MLEADISTLGLWHAGSEVVAGTHALVVGVSDYPYLSGGSAPPGERAPDSGGLGQLEVSALSAALFFDWLRSITHVAGAPVASCRLLLAPRPDEMQRVDNLTGGHYALANYEALRAALIAWGDQLALGGRSAGPNVALFFFSGHGVEVAAAPAILARDVFDQKAADGGSNKALAVDPMTTAIRTYNIDRGLLFIDACRDSPKVARLLNIVGDQPLRTNPNPLRRVDAMIRLQSTASGLRSYQVATDPGTIFTQAILDGLKGPPPSYIPYDTNNIPWQLLFSALEGHAKRKVMELLKGHSPLALQPVEPYGYPYNANMLVATKAGPDLGTAAPAILQADGRTPDIKLRDAVELGAADMFAGVTAVKKDELEALRFRGLPASDLGNGLMMHAIFGHEGITEPWVETLRFLDARTGEDADSDTARIVAAHREEIDGRAVAWVDLAIRPNPGGAIWIGAGDREVGSTAAVVVLQDLNYPIPVRLDITFDQQDYRWALTALSARLSDPADLEQGVPPAWQVLWEAQRIEAFADLASAGQKIESMLHLRDVVDEKSESPIAAALAVNFLLRSNGIDYLEHWPRNLANWFDWLPDGPVLWAETLLRRYERNPNDDSLGEIADGFPTEALDYFLMAAERGAPLLLNSLIIAVRQAASWRERFEAGRLPGHMQFRMEQALGAVERAGHFLVSGGTFARFVATDMAISPEVVLGARRRPQRVAIAA